MNRSTFKPLNGTLARVAKTRPMQGFECDLAALQEARRPCPNQIPLLLWFGGDTRQISQGTNRPKELNTVPERIIN